jgi:hypothetical protein
MEDFANQLANLQRAATRASSSDNTHNGIVNGFGIKRSSNYDAGNGRRTKKCDRGYNGNGHDKRRGGGEVYNDDKQRGQNEGPSLRTLIESVAERYSNDIAKMKQTTRKPDKRRRHIALLFLTIDDLPHEHIWQEWLSTNSDSTNNNEEEDWGVLVSVIVHAKYPHKIQSPWLKQRHLLQQQCSKQSTTTTAANVEERTAAPVYHTRKPEWGSVDITKAMMDLLEEGLKIGTPTTATTTMEDGGRRYLSSTTCQQSKCNNVSLATSKATASHMKDDDGHDNEEIPPVDRFIFVSESCLPVTTLKECELALFGPRHPSSSSHSDDNNTTTITSKDDLSSSLSLYDKSWIHARSTPNNGYAKQLQWDAILRHKSKEDDSTTTIPSQCIWKSDQWVILTRKHAVAITTLPHTYLNNNTLLDTIFTNVRASDEIYIPTVLSILGIIHRPMGVKEVEDYNYDTTTNISGQKRRRITKEDESLIGYEIRRRRSTYCDWSMGAKNPVSFSTIQEWKDVVCLARNEGCLFARKFVTTPSSTRGGGRAVSQSMFGKDGGLITVEAWKAAIYHSDKNT